MKIAIMMFSLFALPSLQADADSRGWHNTATLRSPRADVDPLSGKRIDECSCNYSLESVNLFFAYSRSATSHLATGQDNDASLFARIERVIKLKEPDWELVIGDERKGAADKYFTLDWKKDDEYVSTTTYEMIDSEDASRVIGEYFRAPISVPVRREQILGLGDEAYTLGEGPYGKKGSGTLIVRRGKMMIRLETSSLATAERFARHILEELDVR